MRIDELMIGNWVMIKEHFYKGVITCIDKENGIVKTDVEEFFEPLTFEDIEPLPLTPEILEKAGFTLDAAPQVPEWSCDGKFIFHDAHYEPVYSTRLLNEYDVEFKYVHELQNYFYTLTGKPLQITL